jgi:tight adherence protein C
MQVIIFAVGGLFFIGVGVVLAILSVRNFSVDEIKARLNEYVTDESGRLQPLRTSLLIRSREFSGSILTRIFLPLFQRLVNFLGSLSPASMLESLRHKLTIAGNPMGIGAREFFGMRILSIIIGTLLAIFFLSRGRTSLYIMGAALSFVFFLLLADVWLHSRVRRRQDAIRKGLPDALDMLSVCASAGLGFDQSLQRVSEHWETAIGEEFARVISEMEMGLSRRDAMRSLADRLEIQEISSFVAFVLQSEQLGMSISDTLHAQAAQSRIERRFRAQEQAQKIPTKMLIPLAFLIFPAIIAVVLGPSIPRLFNLFSTF